MHLQTTQNPTPKKKRKKNHFLSLIHSFALPQV